MKKRLQVTFDSTKNHVDRNRGKYASLATAAMFVVLMQTANKQWTEFLIEKGIDPDEFFNPENLGS